MKVGRDHVTVGKEGEGTKGMIIITSVMFSFHSLMNPINNKKSFLPEESECFAMFTLMRGPVHGIAPFGRDSPVIVSSHDQSSDPDLVVLGGVQGGLQDGQKHGARWNVLDRTLLRKRILTDQFKYSSLHGSRMWSHASPAPVSCSSGPDNAVGCLVEVMQPTAPTICCSCPSPSPSVVEGGELHSKTFVCKNAAGPNTLYCHLRDNTI